MSKTIIKVENLSKRYRLGLKEKQADTLVGQFKNMLKAPYRNYKRLLELSKFGVDDESVFWALKDVSFEVKEGEVLGIIGKNGAGKSTLLKILSQITDPTSGRIELHGRVASLLEVGTGFHPELTGRENIYMNGTILGMTKREIDYKLDEIVDFSGVEKFLDTPVKFYSSGMKVRLGFSVAAHLDPEILVIDEVLAVGDFEFQQKCLGKMEDVSKNQGRTVLFVSHQMDAVRSLCSKSLLLEGGKMISKGSTEGIVNKYLSQSKINLKNEFKASGLKAAITSIVLNDEELKKGNLLLEIKFESKIEIYKPLIGFVLYNERNNPIFGSNPRIHDNKLKVDPVKKGCFQATVEDLELHSGTYHMSFWLSDGTIDLDYKREALTFNYNSPLKYTYLPDISKIGSVDKIVNWSFKN